MDTERDRGAKRILPKPRLSHADYRVAWLCALPLELAAARLMLDDVHEDLPRKPLDNNTYVLGRVGHHNVVLACLPSGRIGVSPVSEAVSQLRWSFPKTELGVLVGVGGGVPGPDADIRLGDVVVSHPSSSYGGVVPYDRGKIVQKGRFVATGVVNGPPTSLLTAISKVRATHLTERSPAFCDYLAAAERRWEITRPDASTDVLFESGYDHADASSSCQQCDETRTITRLERSPEGLRTHYGLIASTGYVMKHGMTRDLLRDECGVLCFDMEAAGIMNILPTLVIRGICDYADSHKTKIWQPYAALAAAAYAKEVLHVLPAEVSALPHPQDDLIPLASSREDTQLARHSDSWSAVLHKMSDYNPHKVHRRLASQRMRLTTDWFLDDPNYQKWYSKGSDQNCLWCSGRVGSGKTMVCTRVIDHQKARLHHKGLFPASFYCEPSEKRTLNPLFVLASLMKQSLEYLREVVAPGSEDIKQQLMQLYAPGYPEPDLEELADVLSAAFRILPNSVYIIDGIHELRPEDISKLLLALRNLFQEHSGQRLLIFSRDELGHGNGLSFARRVTLSEECVKADIRTFVESTITSKMGDFQITDSPKVLQHIKQTLLEKADGMFLWVRLQIDSLWRDCKNDADILDALENLPRDLPETYRRCLDHIPDLTREYAPKVMQWVRFAAYPLTVPELKEAVAFGLSTTSWDERKIPSRNMVIGSCANLVVEDDTDHKVRFTHPSVLQFLSEMHQMCPPEYRLDPAQGELQCGEACVNYLSFDNFSLQLQKLESANVKMQLPSPRSILDSVIPQKLQSLRSHLFGAPESFEELLMLNALLPVAGKPPNKDKYGLLPYARKSWTYHTKSLTNRSVVWEKFRNLALHPNNVWGIQPWPSDVPSRASYLHGVLAWATREDHIPLLSLLLEKSQRQHLQMTWNLPLVLDGLPALHSASRLGFAAVVSSLLEVCDANIIGPDSKTALHYAAEKNHVEVVRLLLAKGAQVSALSSSNETALELAVRNGATDAVRELLGRMTSILPTPLPLHLIQLAAAYGNVETLELLLDRCGGVDLEAIRLLAAHSAARHGRAVVVGHLLQRGLLANAEISDRSLRTIASYHTQKPATETTPSQKATPISLDFSSGNGRAAPVLWLSQGSIHGNVGVYDKLLHTAAYHGHEAVVAVVLSRKGVEANSGNRFGDTPLHLAAKTGHEAVVERLLEYGVDVNIRGHFKDTPLHMAARNGHVAVAKLLLSRKDLDLCATNENDVTALEVVLSARFEGTRTRTENILRILLEHYDILIDPGRVLLETPWYPALKGGNGAMLPLSPEHLSGSPHVANRENESPLHKAATNSLEGVVNSFLEHHAPVKTVSVFQYGQHWDAELFYAPKIGQEAVFHLLCKHEDDEDVETDGEDNFRELSPFEVVRVEHEDVITLLLRRWAERYYPYHSPQDQVQSR